LTSINLLCHPNRVEIDIPEGSYSFWKKLTLIIVFLAITPLTLFASTISLIALSHTSGISNQSEEDIVNYSLPGAQVYASLPSTFPSISGEIVASDARGDIIENFLKKYGSPLEPYSEFMIQTSDKYNLDYRLLAAIAMKESGLCKAIPDESYNCWGWGIHSKGTLKFSSFEEGIETVSKGLKESYIDKGYGTVEEIMTKYAHPDSTTWAEGVLQYMNQMK